MNEHGITDVDSVWYLQRYPDVAASGMTASDHFTTYGRKEGRIPNALAEQILNEDAFDLAWYAITYADNLNQDGDPITHYLLFGKRYQCFPNSDAQQRAAQIETFDPIWYLHRNRDVAQSGMKPLDHFLTYGHDEGRSPNERAESRARWRGWFDPEWYTARYDDVAASGLSPLEHYLRLGVYAGRAPNTAAENRAIWDQVLDPEWYTARYEDVAPSGMSPLEHFITYGIISGRKPNASAIPEHEPVEQAKLELLKSGDLSSRVVLFVTHAPDGQIKPHVIQHLAAYKNAGISILLILASNSSQTDTRSRAFELADIIIRRENRGYDFAAWAHAFRKYKGLFRKEIIFLANDSVFGPLTQEAFVRTLRAIGESQADVVGITDNFQLGWHLQSYFLAVKSRALNASPFQRFMGEVVSYKRKSDVISEYETKFTRFMSDQELKCEAIYKAKDQSNATLDSWRDLTVSGMPYVKASLFNRCTVKTDITGWRQHLNQLGYSTTQADNSIAQTCLSAQNDDYFDYSKGLISQRNALHNLHKFFASGARLPLRESDSPALSIVLVSHDQAEFLYPLLKRFSDSPFSAEVELIILEHASTDDTNYLASRVDGCALHRLPKSAHSVDLVTEATRVARGRHVLLLRHTIFISEALVETALSWSRSKASHEIYTGIILEDPQYPAYTYPLISGISQPATSISRHSVIAKREDEDPLSYLMLFNKEAVAREILPQNGPPHEDDLEGSFRALLRLRGLVERPLEHLTIVTV